MMKKTSVILAMLVACVGCSYDGESGYTTKSPYPENVHTVAVPIWNLGANVYRRGLEMRLTEALVKRIELDTPYKVTDKSRADTILSGTIDTVEQRVLSYNPDSGYPREKEVTLVISFTWTDLRNGKTLVKKTNFRVAATYLPDDEFFEENPTQWPGHYKPYPFKEDFFQGSEDALNKMAIRIVEQMETPW
jgi:hypothetical protein